MSIWKKIFRRKRKGAEFSGKLKLYSMRKVEDKSIFKIEKRQEFISNFKVLLGNLGFDGVETWHYDSSKGEFPVSKLVNFCDTFKNKTYEIEIIFTQDREIIIIKSSESGRKRFVEELMQFCEWFETKNLNPVVRSNF